MNDKRVFVMAAVLAALGMASVAHAQDPSILKVQVELRRGHGLGQRD